MSEKEPNIKIPVDLTNPGQFFACCGLLELADRLWPGAEVAGWFELHPFDRATFRVTSTTLFTAQLIVKTLMGCPRKSVDPVQPIRGSDGKPAKDAEKTRPVLIGAPVNLKLSWWLNEVEGTQTAFKTWSANITSLGLFEDTASVVDPESATDVRLFTTAVGMTGRYGFDRRSSWDTLNTGYSPNEQGEKVDSYPTVELLAAVGLQNFCPLVVKDMYHFIPWEHPLPTIAARAAVSGAVRTSETSPYGFSVLSRGKFKSFSKAQHYYKEQSCLRKNRSTTPGSTNFSHPTGR
jgi:CRISPR-associated protein Csx14